jgi:hypothetical protein
MVLGFRFDAGSVSVVLELGCLWWKNKKTAGIRIPAASERGV